MWGFLKRRLVNDSGAIDKIIVTLLLIVIGVAGVVGLSTWLETQSTTIETSATARITAVITEASGI